MQFAASTSRGGAALPTPATRAVRNGCVAVTRRSTPAARQAVRRPHRAPLASRPKALGNGTGLLLDPVAQGALGAAVLRAAPPPGERPRALVADCGGASPAALVAAAGAAEGPGGCVDVLVVSSNASTLRAVALALPPPSGPLGNAPGVRTALLSPAGVGEARSAEPGAGLGALFSLPTYQGPFAFAALLGGDAEGTRAAAVAASLRLKPGAGVVTSSPLDVRGLALERLWTAADAEGRAASLVPGLCFRVPLGLALPGGRAPAFVSGPAVRGRGRGGAALGFPTANLPVDDPTIRAALEGFYDGVYFGWATVDDDAAGPTEGPEELGGKSRPEAPGATSGLEALGATAAFSGSASAVWPCIANVGTSPTFRDALPERTLEVHVDHRFSAPFYGSRVRALLVGFVRPELRFGSLDELVDRIRADLGLARAQLSEVWTDVARDPRLR